ncbi:MULTISPECIES: hypothetical protein [Hafniaceae]|uniref:hypothetical protein n=1 Tax=Hafniaceae TaxID=1903412 RepID=UPI0024319D98|nr:hypothetical protein [Obesumbacterium proteus]
MVETQVKFVVVGHHSRYKQALCLAESLGAVLLIDSGDHGANWNHHRALEWAAEQSCRVVVIEDDALPVPNFHVAVVEWLARFPDNLVSFYLGTGRPPQYQMQIAERLVIADKSRADFITMPRLIHGVCYSVPQQHLPRVLARWDSSKAADYAVGDAHGGSVVYPCYSLVDHADGQPVEVPQDGMPRTERRKAWRLAL